MALWLNLNINSERIGTVEIRRREHLDLTEPTAIANVWSTYDVFRDDRLIGQVRHVYGHGAWKLLALATGLIASAPCCDLHNEHCEAPGELCCAACTEAAHVGLFPHADGSRCVLQLVTETKEA